MRLVLQIDAKKVCQELASDAEGINPVDRRDFCIDVHLADFFSETIPNAFATSTSPAAQDRSRR
jgi:hypothetical protein